MSGRKDKNGSEEARKPGRRKGGGDEELIDSNMAAFEVEEEVNNEEGISDISKVKLMFTLLTAKINTLESGFENKLKYMEKWVAERLSSFLTEVLIEQINIIVEEKERKHLSPMRAEYTGEISELKAQIETMQTLESNKNSVDSQNYLRMALRDLPRTENVNVINKVNAVIQNGLKPNQISVESAVRVIPSNPRPGQHGIIFAKCRSKANKTNIMENKAKLKDVEQFKKVNINNYKGKQRLEFEANIRTIVSTFGHDTLIWKGNRFIKNNK